MRNAEHVGQLLMSMAYAAMEIGNSLDDYEKRTAKINELVKGTVEELNRVLSRDPGLSVDDVVDRVIAELGSRELAKAAESSPTEDNE